jgi:hypothetical protein
MNNQIEHYVDLCGEKYRRLITSALEFLHQHEPLWGLEEKVNVAEYLLIIICSRSLDKKEIPV